MNFSNAEEMQKYVCEDCNDLYNPQNHTYLAVYNDSGAVIVHTVTPQEAVKLEYDRLTAENNYWGENGELSSGGYVYDDAAAFFQEEFEKNGSNWIDTKDVVSLIDKPKYGISHDSMKKELEHKLAQEKAAPTAEKNMKRGAIER